MLESMNCRRHCRTARYTTNHRLPDLASGHRKPARWRTPRQLGETHSGLPESSRRDENTRQTGGRDRCSLLSHLTTPARNTPMGGSLIRPSARARAIRHPFSGNVQSAVAPAAVCKRKLLARGGVHDRRRKLQLGNSAFGRATLNPIVNSDLALATDDATEKERLELRFMHRKDRFFRASLQESATGERPGPGWPLAGR